MNNDNKLKVEAIKCGTVIDHIPEQIGFKLLSLFHLTKTEQRITIGLNLPSNQMGRKDLIKIENTFLSQDQINQLAIYAPYATINCINKYAVVDKITPKMPDQINNLLTCPNSNCISRIELSFSNFIMKYRVNDIYLKCKYCEREFTPHVVLVN
ncbi:MAG: aspartate carbamoyltransferase regulatory subunit [Pantoea sp. Brub]|nr:aspartate carbamoyltransferase regulatory subunit [Pantoea sp. Brub]